MSTALATSPVTRDFDAIEQALVVGDLSKLTPAQRVSYYNQVCQSLGLNPLTKPFAYITLNGKLTLYALKDCTEQLRNNRDISVEIKAREVVEDCYVVTARAAMPRKPGTGDYRSDESIGAVPIGTLKGESRANAMMKAETKAKRRVTLSICGLGMLDETEIDSIPHGEPQGYTVTPPAVPSALPPTEESRENASAPKAGASGDSSTRVETPPDDGRIYLLRIDVKKTKNPNVKRYEFTFSNGVCASTINDRLAGLAEQLCQARTPVLVETKDTRWGAEVTALHADTSGELDMQADLDEEPPFDDSQISF